MNVLQDISATRLLNNTEWYKDAIIYQLHVKAFADSNGDGIGDFNGLTERLDYLQELGVTALWLLPFYPSPGRDDGYDIADYRNINSDFGTMRDFRRFMTEAKKRGLKIITELVINHTSDQHPWFQRARTSRPGTDARNWYVWSDTADRYRGTRIIFTDTEKSNWSWDPVAGAYYWHRFFSHQPDLNFANPRVIAAITQVMRRWLDFGVDGFRLDAIPYLCEREGTNNENLPETHAVIKQLRAEVDSYAPGTVLLAEANQWPEDVSAYFGDGDECHMAYHFPLMPRIYMAIAQEDRFPITDILGQTPDIPSNCQWALFLRNHDELTLEMVTDAERDYLWSAYAADPRARINLGIRRRLASLMDNDRRKIELMNGLLLSFPGTPIIYYGDEIGMGDNIYLGDRNSMRTPMQWTPDRNGGFSRSDPAKLFLPPIMDAVYGYHAVNVEAQSRSLSSLLSWNKRMMAVRKSSQIFGRGSLAFIRPSNRAVIAYVREYNGEAILCIANLSRSAQAAELDLSQWNGRAPIEMLGRTPFQKISDEPYAVTLAPYGFFWLMLSEEAGQDAASAYIPEWVTLVFNQGWNSLCTGRSHQFFIRDVLPPFLASRRWFAQKDSELTNISIAATLPWSGNSDAALALLDVTARGETSRYALPLAVQWSRAAGSYEQTQPILIAPVRRGHVEGILVEATADRDVVMDIVRQIHQNATIDASRCQIKFLASRRFAEAPIPAFESVSALHGEQSNSTIIIDASCVLKIYRRLSAGPNPEIDIGRFLTEVARYTHAPALLGTVELFEPDTSWTIAVMHEFVENQGEAWTFTGAYLDRFLEEERLLTAQPRPDPGKHASFLNRIQQIGRRVGELHAALSSSDLADFAPEPITPAVAQTMIDTVIESAQDVFDRLREERAHLDERAATFADALLRRREAALERLRGLLPGDLEIDQIRHHGDLHLGQILIVKDDACIIDFEGEPNRSPNERRRKAPAARDVAGFIRSLDYAATSALGRVMTAAPEEHVKVSAAIDRWRLQSTRAFLAGVREAASPTRLWPRDEAVARRLLRFFIAEKAFYEIGYELANRPDWVMVPLAGAVHALFDDGGDT